MKLTYNIALSFAHIVCLLGLLAMGFIRMIAWLNWYWLNDLVFLLLTTVALVGQWLLLHRGKQKAYPHPLLVRILATLDYVFFSLQLALVTAMTVWCVAAPLLSERKTFSALMLLQILPVAVVDIAAMVFRKNVCGTESQEA